VIGVAPAVIGSIQATEAIKWIVGIGALLENRMLVYDGLAMRFTEFRIQKNPDCDHCADTSGKD
jgi:adenylyltransferase/sulfurtransferase